MDADVPDVTNAEAHGQILRFEAQHTVDQAMIAHLLSDRLIDQDKIANLELALVTARRIGAAVGIIMALEKVTEDQAFQVLRKASQKQNRKLRDVADDVLTAGTTDDNPPRAT